MEEVREMLTPILNAYDFGGEIREVKEYGEGHVNRTYRVVVETPEGTKRYILQRVDTGIFKDPEGLMENIVGVTEYLRDYLVRTGGDPERGTMRVLFCRDGKSYHTTPEGEVYRVLSFVEDTICLQQVESQQDFYESAYAFGQFQNQLADYPASTLHETIARFHDTPDRYAKLEAAIAADSEGRVADAAEEIAFCRARKEDCRVLMDLLAEGKLPLRVTHNDTKLNNILLDSKTRKGICIIDLDTVMPGLAANDFGDAIRFGANHSAEDEPDLSKVNFDLSLYKTYLRGYLDAAGESLTELEKETLPWGARIITLECGMRFLTDYLEGDHYFNTSRPGQNLDRARTQFKLVSDMEKVFDEMMKAVKEN